MAKTEKVKKHHEPLIHMAKRDDIPGWKAWLIRLSAVLVGFLVMSLVLTALAGASSDKVVTFGDVMNRLYLSVFGRMMQGKFTQMWKFLQEAAILLCLSLAVTPAFKMKFWNCGAEGQALFGGLAAMFCMINLGGKIPEAVLVLIVVIASVLGGALWGVIPAIFHAKYRTNETLFTLMMNYVATQMVAYYVYANGQGSNVINPVSTGALPVIGGQQYLLNVLVVAVITVLVYIYLRYSKQGYEIAVVGESRNTARYIGINVKKVVIRTMLISGALCGIAGMLLVAGKDHSINTATVGGQGFTAIMVSWLGQFNPFIIAGMAALVSALQIGAAGTADAYFLNSAYADVMVGVVVLCLVACEFFVRYTIRFRHSKKGGAAA
ncbi:MAG: ABC transporter permease [Clostridia bacterium]|nr:ABC transporter permease [Clostridia bacterium]